MELLSWQSAQALGFVGALVGGAVTATIMFAPKASTKIQLIYVWLAFDALCHMILEASWLYLSTGGRTVNKSNMWMAYLWRDYSKADQRWGWADPTVVALEILTVLGAGPIAAYCAYLLSKNDQRYHIWVIILSTAELYGGFMTFAPEWLTGNQYLIGPSNFLLFWVYLCFLNLVWVAIPFYLIFDSYNAITAGLKNAYPPIKRASTPKKKK